MKCAAERLIECRAAPREEVSLGERQFESFDYNPGRGGEVADALIEGCSGYLQSDGYEVYAGASARAELIHVGCFAHARRRLFEALKALPNGVRKSESAAYEGVRRIDELYATERQIRTLSDEERTRIRRERAVPPLESLHEWATRLQRDTPQEHG